MIEEGQPAPSFTLPSDTGEDVTLESLRGERVVLYFYPRDDTPGCTAQACGIRDGWEEFERRGAVVVGVSPDSPGSHAKFKEKYGLPFMLLSDEEHVVAERYGTWVEKQRYGKSYMGVERSTFVIDEKGTVLRVMRKVEPDTHAADVLAVLPDARAQTARSGNRSLVLTSRVRCGHCARTCATPCHRAGTATTP